MILTSDEKQFPPLGLAHFTVLEVPPLELVSLAAGIGYAAIGLRLYPAFPGAPFYELPAGTTHSQQVRSRLRDEGIQVHDIEFVTIDADFSAARLEGVLEAASALGARRISVCGDDPDRARLTANFASLCDLAAQYVLGVDLECMAWRQVASFADALEVVSAANRHNGGLLVDALHLSRSGGSPTDLRTAPARLIRSAQLCDAVAVRPTTQEALIKEARSGRLPPGQGALPLRELLAELPDGTALSVEVPLGGSADPKQHARDNFLAAQTLFAALRQSP
jgi:sugar phosphate isomerase/epimerase